MKDEGRRESKKLKGNQEEHRGRGGEAERSNRDQASAKELTYGEGHQSKQEIMWGGGKAQKSPISMLGFDRNGGQGSLGKGGEGENGWRKGRKTKNLRGSLQD